MAEGEGMDRGQVGFSGSIAVHTYMQWETDWSRFYKTVFHHRLCVSTYAKNVQSTYQNEWGYTYMFTICKINATEPELPFASYPVCIAAI